MLRVLFALSGSAFALSGFSGVFMAVVVLCPLPPGTILGVGHGRPCCNVVAVVRSAVLFFFSRLVVVSISVALWRCMLVSVLWCLSCCSWWQRSCRGRQIIIARPACPSNENTRVYSFILFILPFWPSLGWFFNFFCFFCFFWVFSRGIYILDLLLPIVVPFFFIKSVSFALSTAQLKQKGLHELQALWHTD